MSIRKVAILYLIVLLLQLSFINVISIHGFGPNLILCLTVVIIFKFEYGFRCIPFAIVAALLQDICTGSVVGIAPLAIFAVGIAVTWIRVYLNTDLYKTMISVGAVATLLYDFIAWILMALLQTHYSMMYMLKYQIFYVLYHVAVMALMFFLFSDRFQKWKEAFRRRREEDEE